MLRALLLLSVLIVAISAMGFQKSQDCADEVCPKGFKEFKRTNGKWCVKLYPGNMTWWEAERECRCTTKGATLSGIEGPNEKMWVEQNAQSLLDQEKIENGAIWIGAYRRYVCPSGNQSSWAKNALCSNEKMFQFTDRHTCKTFIFQNWADKFPTSAAGDDCGVLLVSTEASGSNSDNSGKVADKNCQSVGGSSAILNSVGFLCGVKPAPGGGGGHSYGGGDESGEIILIGAGKPKKH